MSVNRNVSYCYRILYRESENAPAADPFYVEFVRLFPFWLCHRRHYKQSWQVAFSHPRNAYRECYQIPLGRIKAASLADTVSPAPQH